LRIPIITARRRRDEDPRFIQATTLEYFNLLDIMSSRGYGGGRGRGRGSSGGRGNVSFVHLIIVLSFGRSFAWFSHDCDVPHRVVAVDTIKAGLVDVEMKIETGLVDVEMKIETGLVDVEEEEAAAGEEEEVAEVVVSL
jgi:hypothetical protein